MIPIIPEASFPISERLQTEYSEDDEESRNFRLKVMMRLLAQWADCFFATGLALAAYAGYLLYGFSLLTILAPLAGLDMKLMFQSAQELRHSVDPEPYRPQMKVLYMLELIEHACTLLCKALLALTITTGMVPLPAATIPLALHLIIRFLYRETALNDCYSFSGMVRSMQFRLIWRCTRLSLLLTVSLKLGELVEWRWASVFWPGWVTLSMLTLISIGVLLLVFGSVCAWITGEVRTKEVICVCWFLYVTAGSCASMILLLMFFSKTLDGYDFQPYLVTTVIGSSVFCLSVVASTRLMLQILGYSLCSMWWDTFFYALDVTEDSNIPTNLRPVVSAHARKVSRQLITVGQATPKLLVLCTQIRVSSTYFKPASVLLRKKKAKALTKLNFTPVVVSEGVEIEEPSSASNPNIKLLATKKRSESIEMSRAHRSKLGSITEDPQLPLGNWSEICHKKCIICFENMSDAVFMNCGHGGICIECATAIWKRADTCHCCRSSIDHILRIEDTAKNTVSVVSVTYEKPESPPPSTRPAEEPTTVTIDSGISPV